jgi:hypothetical protein
MLLDAPDLSVGELKEQQCALFENKGGGKGSRGRQMGSVAA